MPGSPNDMPAEGGDAALTRRSLTGGARVFLSERKRGLPYPAGLRSRVISAVQAGISCQRAAAQYGVSKSAVGKWVLRFRRTGSVAAKARGGDRVARLKAERNWMLAKIAAEPALTLTELHRELCARGVRVGYASIKRALKKEKIELGK